MLSITMPARLLSRLVVEASDTVFRNLSDEAIVRLLRNEDSMVRKGATLKAVCALPRRRVSTLLTNYLTEARRFYNVIHWFDFGLSTPRDRAIAGARKTINLAFETA
jgi:hypothetical protein